MTYIIFTYKKDECPVQVCVDRIRQLDDDAKIIIIDDAKNCLRRIPKNIDFYEKSTFERNRNLNGMECVRGELKSFIKYGRKYNSEGIVKVDSDAFLNSVDIIRDNIDLFDFIGFEGSVPLITCGLVYYISNRASQYVLDTTEKDIFNLNNAYPEDQTISKLIAWSTLDRKIYYRGKRDIFVGAYANDEKWQKYINVKVAIHFGNTRRKDPTPNNNIIATDMKNYNNWILSHSKTK